MGSNIPELDAKETKNISLTLFGLPTLDYLCVFIRDPNNPDIYRFRKFGVVPGLYSKKNLTIPFVDIERLDMGEYDTTPVPKEQLSRAVKTIAKAEKELVANDPRTKSIQGVVGIAEYKGSKELSLDDLINLIGMKYHFIKNSYKKESS